MTIDSEIRAYRDKNAAKRAMKDRLFTAIVTIWISGLLVAALSLATYYATT